MKPGFKRSAGIFRNGVFFGAWLVLVMPLYGEVLQDDWARALMSDNQIGYFHIGSEKVQESGQDIFVSVEETKLSFKRGGVVLNIFEKTEIREDESGKVLGFKMERRMGNDLMEVSGKLKGNLMELQSNGMTSTVIYPKGSLGPHKIDRAIREKGFAPGTSTAFSMFNRENPDEAFTLTTVFFDKERRTIGGQDRDWTVSTSTMSHIPQMPSKTWADAEGNFELIELQLGGLGTVAMQRSSKEEALQETQPAEMFTNTLVKPSQPISLPEKLTEAIYRLTVPKTSVHPFLDDKTQKVEAKGEGVYEITISMPVKPPAETVFKDAPLQEASNAPYLKPSPYLQSEDPGVVALAKQIGGGESNALTLATRIQQAVYLKITKKNLSTGMATAATVAKTLEGDCTEHAVLCAAIARALGIPSRVVVGIVYAPSGGMAGNFGYHMWAEALVAPNVWWPMDAAFNRFDVTHIAMARSAMDKTGFESELVLPVVQVMGNLKIDVLETK